MKIMTFRVLWVLQFCSINTTLLNFFFFFFSFNWTSEKFFHHVTLHSLGFFYLIILLTLKGPVSPPACVPPMWMFPYSLLPSYPSFNISSDLNSVLPSLRKRPLTSCVTRMLSTTHGTGTHSTLCNSCQHSWVVHFLLSFFYQCLFGNSLQAPWRQAPYLLLLIFFLVPVTVPSMYVEWRIMNMILTNPET